MKNNVQGSTGSPHSVHKHSVHEKIILGLLIISVFVYLSESSFIHNIMADRVCGRQLMTHNDRLINKLIHGREGYFFFQNALPEACPSLSFLFYWSCVQKARERCFHNYWVFETCPSNWNEHDTWYLWSRKQHCVFEVWSLSSIWRFGWWQNNAAWEIELSPAQAEQWQP